MYKPEAPDENSDCFHIINLENGNSTILVEDFLEGDRECKHLYLITITIDKYLAYNDSVFYVSSSKQMKLFTLVDDVEEGQEQRISPEESEIATIRPDDMKIHGLFVNKFGAGSQRYIIVALETDDNQIDFNQLFIDQKPPSSDFSYTFKQFREVVPRKSKFDPITKFSCVLNEDEYSYAVTLRQSGKVDLYYNMQRVSTYECKRSYS